MPEKNDSFVQATNNSSIVSKRSVEALYSHLLYPNNKQYFKYVVPNGKRRSPVINRGYLLRILVIRNLINKLVENNENTIFVINLGCGFDPIAFEYLDNSNKDFVFIDIDFHNLINEKVKMIKVNKDLQKIIKFNQPSRFDFLKSKKGYQIVTDSYLCIQCDLNNSADYEEILKDLNLLTSKYMKIFLAEVSITYMTPEKSDLIIEHSMKCSSSHFLILEQLIQDIKNQDIFVKLMLRHFHKFNSPIRSVEDKYQTSQQQTDRFLKLSSGKFEMLDLLQYWDHFINAEMKENIKKVELFDEYEEFNLFCTHYYIGHCTNTKNLILNIPQTNIKVLQQLKAKDLGIFFDYQTSSKIKRRFSAADIYNKDSIIINSGYSQTKLSSSLILSNSSTTFKATIQPPERLCHTLKYIPLTNEHILIGGRSAPYEFLNDCWLLSNGNWKQTASLPSSRCRHNTFIVNQYVVVCNGSFTTTDFLLFDTATHTWSSFPIEGDFSPRVGASIVYIGNNKGFIIGGMFDENQIDDSLYCFNIDFDNSLVIIEKIISHPLLSRFGSHATILNDDNVLVIGGVLSSEIELNKDTSIIGYNFIENNLYQISIDEKDWKDFPLLVAGDLVDFNNKEKYYISGGAVCYSFGSYWNGILKISIYENDNNKVLFKDLSLQDVNNVTQSKPVAKENSSKRPVTILPIEKAYEVSSKNPVIVSNVIKSLKSLDELANQYSTNIFNPSNKSMNFVEFPISKSSINTKIQFTKIQFSKPKIQLLSLIHFEGKIGILFGEVLVRLYPSSQVDKLQSLRVLDIFNRNPKLEFNTCDELTPFEMRLIPGDVLSIPSSWIVSIKTITFAVITV